MEKRYQIRVGGHKIDFDYDADTQTWRARRPGSQDHATGQADTLEAARDAVRRYIQDEKPTAESLSGAGRRGRRGQAPSGNARAGFWILVNPISQWKSPPMPGAGSPPCSRRVADSYPRVAR